MAAAILCIRLKENSVLGKIIFRQALACRL